MDGRLSVRLYTAQGDVVWESRLPVSSSANIVNWNAGDFFGSNHRGIFVSVKQARMREESYVLDGKDGRLVWTGQPQNTTSGMRSCRPQGIPTVFDADGDGKDDVMMDYLDFGGYCIGSDGKGHGKIRWRLDLSAKDSWPAIADFDGDGVGEIVLPGSDGLIRVLKAPGHRPSSWKRWNHPNGCSGRAKLQDESTLAPLIVTVSSASGILSSLQFMVSCQRSVGPPPSSASGDPLFQNRWFLGAQAPPRVRIDVERDKSADRRRERPSRAFLGR